MGKLQPFSRFSRSPFRFPGFSRFSRFSRSAGNPGIGNLLQHEITSTSFYLTKDGNLRKSPKSELALEVKQLLPEIPEVVAATQDPSVIVFDFMAYSRKVPVKKLNLRTYEDLSKNLWATFQRLSSNSKRIDIVFDIYLDGSIKQQERSRRGKEHVETTISSFNQTLPVEMDKFWGSSSNKMQLQQVFITWLLETYKDSKPLYLGGANKEDITSCFKIVEGIVTMVPILKCCHEEADDRMFFHINHAIRSEGFKTVIIASPDTDVFINSIHHFARWMFSDLEELWVISGKRGTQQAIPIHQLNQTLDGNVVDVLPAVHALTGYKFILIENVSSTFSYSFICRHIPRIQRL